MVQQNENYDKTQLVWGEENFWSHELFKIKEGATF